MTTPRLDIQILRAIAVMSVAIFHFIPQAVVSGFIGVDIFFVISGFLITQILVRELEARGQVSLRTFYARRIRRIFPAAFVVVLVTTIAVWLSGSPDQIAIHARHVLASSFSVENILLATDSVDYLHQTDAPSALQHYWSLAVEEQFYVVWPPLIVLCALLAARYGKTVTAFIRWAIGGIVVASFTVATVMVAVGEPTVYFNSLARAWELGLGALVAVFAPRFAGIDSHPARPWFRGIAWVLVVGTPFIPGIALAVPGWTLLPTLLATALLLGTTASPTLIPVTLWAAVTPGVKSALHWIGDRSFSIYLWHWPALVVLPLLVHTEMSPGLAVVTLLGVVVVSDLSYRFVENPVRFGQAAWLRSTAWLTSGALVLSGVVSVVAIVGQPSTGEPAPTIDAIDGGSSAGPTPGPTATAGPTTPPRDTIRGIDVTGVKPFCVGAGAALFDCDPGYASTYALDGLTVDPPVNKNCQWTDHNIIIDCVLGDVKATRKIVYVGDSHAKALWPAVDRVGRRAGFAVHAYFTSSCEFRAGHSGKCADQNDAVMAAITQGGYDFVMTRQSVDFLNDVPGDHTAEFEAEWKPILDSGTPLVVIADNPRLTDSMMSCIMVHPENGSLCAFPRAEGYRYADDAVSAAQALDVPVINFANILCGHRLCQPTIGGIRVYRDLGHLSTVFSETLSPFLYAELDGLGLIAPLSP